MFKLFGLFFVLLAVSCVSAPSRCQSGEVAHCNDAGKQSQAAGDIVSARQFYRSACRADDTRGCFNLGTIEARLGNMEQAKNFRIHAVNRSKQLCESGSNVACEFVIALPRLMRGCQDHDFECEFKQEEFEMNNLVEAAKASDLEGRERWRQFGEALQRAGEQMTPSRPVSCTSRAAGSTTYTNCN